MISRRQAVLGAAAFAFGGATFGQRLARAEDGLAAASPWVVGLGARMRLLRGAPLADKDGAAAGIEIALDPGFKTYWRMPGDAGVPPVFDWSGSGNLASIATDWPAPQRFAEAGVSVIGYGGDNVVLPLRIAAADAAIPVKLALTLSYAACKTICVPLKADAALLLPPDAPGGLYASLIEAASREVPRRVEAAALGLDRPGSVSLSLARGHSGLSLHPRLEADERVLDIFVEAPGNWLFGAPRASSDRVSGDPSPQPNPSPQLDLGPQLDLPLLDHPKRVDRAEDIPFTLTLVTDRRAVETMIGVRPVT
ncbi:Thiol-disulfide interchange protein, contains DsbC and DsbD domains [Rhizobiales bacterium GAS191]|nr:Thiol-disulfide interchange protein, contains DsbC and DsbD domains [Rhizobiales bacterium GAS191]